MVILYFVGQQTSSNLFYFTLTSPEMNTYILLSAFLDHAITLWWDIEAY